jgi:hypothetical protein
LRRLAAAANMSLSCDRHSRFLYQAALDNATYECASVMSIAGAQRKGLGYCKFLVPDGDFVVGEQVLRSTGGGNWKGIAGGGEFVRLTSGKPVVTGTEQSCVRASGTYEPSRSCGTCGHHIEIPIETAGLALTKQIRVCHQCQDGQCTRHYHSAFVAEPGRRGDKLTTASSVFCNDWTAPEKR